MSGIRIAILAAATGLMLSSAACAAGKVGTWEIVTKTDGGAGTSDTFCMTAEMVRSNRPPMSLTGHCVPHLTTMNGNRFSSDVECAGPAAAGSGHVNITFSSAEHYHGEQTVTIKLAGRMRTTTIVFDGRWLSPRCGDEH